MSTAELHVPGFLHVQSDVNRALLEDIGTGDLNAALVDADAVAHARLLCREPIVLAGSPWFDACFRSLDAHITIDWHYQDGDTVPADSIVCRVHGNARALLSAERTALNFLQTLSATATNTARHVAVVAGTGTTILDTRKTLPGLRMAQKYAVRCGGGSNHRMGLFDAILIKENHIAAAGSIAAAVAAARAIAPGALLEVEVENLDELEQAIGAGVDRIMLDEFDDATLDEALTRVAGRIPIEVSGSVDLERLRELATRGIDFISIGALTKNIHAVDLSLRIQTA